MELAGRDVFPVWKSRAGARLIRLRTDRQGFQSDFLGFEGKMAVVTGGGSSIGRAIVVAFAEQETNVAVAELNEAQGRSVHGETNALAKGKADNIRTDVTDWDSVQEMVKQALDRLISVDGGYTVV